MQRWAHNMARCFPCLLDNVFAQVSFHDIKTRALQEAVQSGLFRHNGFSLGDTPGVVLLADIQDEAVEFLAVTGKVDLIAVVHGFLFKLTEVVVQIIQTVLPNFLYVVPEVVKTFETVNCSCTYLRREQRDLIAALGLPGVF